MSDIGALVDYPIPAISNISTNCIGSLSIGQNATYSSAAAWPTSNLAIFIPFRLGYIYTAQNMFWVNGTTQGNNADIGIYDAQGNQLVHSGSTATSGATSVQAVSITATTLRPGLYYLAFAVNGTTSTFYRSAPGLPIPRAMGIYTQTTSFPLPSSVTYVGSTTNYIPLIGVTSQGVV